MDFKYIMNTPLYQTFSDLGKRIFLPDGIFYWSGRAKKEAELIGTIGSAYGYEKDFIDGGSSEWVPCYLKDIKQYTTFSINEIVPYAAIAGLPEIRETWKNWIVKKAEYRGNNEEEKLSRLNKFITTPFITSGVTNGIFLSCLLFLNPGEYIISPNKRWGNYDNIIMKNIGAKIKSFEFFKNNEINIQGLREAIEDVSKVQDKIVVLLNFPNNPTGYIPTLKETKEIINLFRECYKPEKPMVLLIDDAYEPYVFRENVLNKSMFYDLHQLEENIIPIKLDGITKELLLYGGRIGFFTIGLKPSWVANDAELESLKSEINNKLEGITRSTVSNCNHFYQALTQKIFKDNSMEQILETRNKVKNLLAARYDKINNEFAKINNPKISVDPNSGGFFLFVNLDPSKIKATDFADHLLKKYKVGVIPIENSNENINGIRIAYCSIDIEKIPEFVKRIQLALEDF